MPGTGDFQSPADFALGWGQISLFAVNELEGWNLGGSGNGCDFARLCVIAFWGWAFVALEIWEPDAWDYRVLAVGGKTKIKGKKKKKTLAKKKIMW